MLGVYISQPIHYALLTEVLLLDSVAEVELEAISLLNPIVDY